MIHASIVVVVREGIIVATVEEFDEAGDAGFGVDGKVNDAFLGFLVSDISLGVG